MGCSISRATRKVITSETSNKISSVKQIIVQPGLFVCENESKFQEVYKIGAVLGTGTYGEVRLCYHRDSGESRAVKIFKKQLYQSELKRCNLISEITILKSLDHPNIIRIYEFFEDSRRLYIVMEYCSGGELFGEIIKRKNFNEIHAAQIMHQIFSALAYMHSKGIIHRDLKPENILLEEQHDVLNIKIIDFGTAVATEGKKISGMIGTPYYIAQEVVDGEYDVKADIWSAGVILYILLSGLPPFPGNNDAEITARISAKNLNFPPEVWNKVSPEAIDFIKLLICDHEHRLTAEAALSHKWVDLKTFRPLCNGDILVGVLSKLQTFHSTNKLRDAVHTFITTQCISLKETRILREVFKTIDKNGDGKLSTQELIDQYSQTMGVEEATKEAERIMKEVDTDNNGFIDYSEFLKANLDARKVLSNDNLKQAFRMFDRDNSGTISASELRQVLQGDFESDEGVWQEIIQLVDQNGDGEIDLQEFQDIVLSKC